MKKLSVFILLPVFLLFLTSCHLRDTGTSEPSQTLSEEWVSTDKTFHKTQDDAERPTDSSHNENAEKETMENKTELHMMIADNEIMVEWENNEAVDALMALAKDTPLTVQMSMYGGFEQVGSLGQSLPREDVQITAQAGDIALYSGDQIVVFYGSNSWSYTRLGHITDKNAQELSDILGKGDVTLTLSMK